MSAPGFKPSANQIIEGPQQTSIDPLPSLDLLRNQMAGKSSSGSEPRLAHIDIAGLQATGIPTPMGGRDRTTDEYRLIKRAILQLATSDVETSHRNLVMVTSTQPGEGKTFTAISLAMSIVAEADTDVLLVDLDIAKQDVCRRFGIHSDIGILNVLNDPAINLPQAFVRTDVPRLSILPAGADCPLAHELIAGAKMRSFMKALSGSYRKGVVIFDVAPVLGAPDASVLAMNVGQVLLVVEANRTGRAAVAETISLLKSCPKISLVLNKVDASELVDYYGSYYGQPYKVPDAGRLASIPERIATFVGNYLRRWYKPS